MGKDRAGLEGPAGSNRGTEGPRANVGPKGRQELRVLKGPLELKVRPAQSVPKAMPATNGILGRSLLTEIIRSQYKVTYT